MIGNCHGARERGKVRPLPQCQSCQHWLSVTGDPVRPALRVLWVDGELAVSCANRKPVKARPASPGRA